MAESQSTIPTKICYTCHVEKPITAYYSTRHTRDGRRGVCSACMLAARRADPKDRERKRVYALKKYHQRAPGERRGRGNRAYTERDRARSRLEYAVRVGRIVRPPTCSECGAAGELQGHHADYSRPFDVEWLCTTCHGRRHRQPEPPPPDVLDRRNHRAKLTWDQVRAIRARAATVTQPILAREFGVSVNTIQRIVARRTWAEMK